MRLTVSILIPAGWQEREGCAALYPYSKMINELSLRQEKCWRFDFSKRQHKYLTLKIKDPLIKENYLFKFQNNKFLCNTRVIGFQYTIIYTIRQI